MPNPMVGYEHPHLYWSGTGRASQETAILGSCQQALLGISNSIWVWCLQVGQSLDGLSFSLCSTLCIHFLFKTSICLCVVVVQVFVLCFGYVGIIQGLLCKMAELNSGDTIFP